MSKDVSSEVRPRFTPCVGNFDPTCDLQEVDQFGFVDLAECYSKGIVPSFSDASDEVFNGVQNPGTMIPRHMDVFDGLRKAEYVRSQLQRLNSEDREKAENQVERSLDTPGTVTV